MIVISMARKMPRPTDAPRTVWTLFVMESTEIGIGAFDRNVKNWITASTTNVETPAIKASRSAVR